MIKVVLAGPPRSGKSCLREGLKQAILGFKTESSGVPYPYVITACPDGEGAWFQETMEKYPEIAKACKAAYKGKFTQEFVRLRCRPRASLRAATNLSRYRWAH